MASYEERNVLGQIGISHGMVTPIWEPSKEKR
jgi:hypothetical protein